MFCRTPSSRSGSQPSGCCARVFQRTKMSWGSSPSMIFCSFACRMRAASCSAARLRPDEPVAEQLVGQPFQRVARQAVVVRHHGEAVARPSVIHHRNGRSWNSLPCWRAAGPRSQASSVRSRGGFSFARSQAAATSAASVPGCQSVAPGGEAEGAQPLGERALAEQRRQRQQPVLVRRRQGGGLGDAGAGLGGEAHRGVGFRRPAIAGEAGERDVKFSPGDRRGAGGRGTAIAWGRRSRVRAGRRGISRRRLVASGGSRMGLSRESQQSP